MLVDIEKVSAKDLTRIIATKEGLDAALKARANSGCRRGSDSSGARTPTRKTWRWWRSGSV
jgi:hypothetical protein